MLFSSCRIADALELELQMSCPVGAENQTHKTSKYSLFIELFLQSLDLVGFAGLVWFGLVG